MPLQRFTTPSTTGNKAYTGFGFRPTYIRFYASGKTSTSETGTRLSIGFADGSIQGCHSLDGNTPQVYIDRVINLSTPSGMIVANLVSFDADGCTLNFSSTVSGYRVHVEPTP